MGFGGFLKGIAKIGTSFIPGVGPIASKAIDGIGAAGEMLGGGAAAARSGRLDEAQLQAMMTQGNNRASMDAAQFNAGREGSLIKRALAAQMLGDLRGPTDPRDKFGGGEVSPVLQQLLARYGQGAQDQLQSGSYKQTPQMGGIPKSGLMEKIGGAAGTAGGILGLLGKMRPQQPPLYGPGN